jgi:ribosomal protein S6--L-glutamate ligase
MVGGAPLVIKLLEGTQGVGVILGETHASAKSTIEAFRGAKQNILVQEFIKEAKGAADEFRSNLHRGGSAERVRITPEERSTAVRSAKTLGLNVAGVDLLRSNHGPVVMEVNSSPGIEGLEKATNLDISSMMIDFLEKNAKPNKTKTRGKG